MVRNQKATGRATTMPVGLMWGAGTSVAVTLLGAAVTAVLLNREVLAESSVGYSVMVILLAASFAGAMTARSRIKRQHLLSCVLSGAVYFLVLLSLTALFFGGQFEAVGVTGLLVMGGSMLALLVDKQPGRGGKRRKIRKRNC